MPDLPTGLREAFQAFFAETPRHAKAWMEMVHALSAASALDEKTASLALTGGVPFHVARAVEAGASREEILSAILLPLPAAGHRVTQSLPPAVAALDQPAE